MNVKQLICLFLALVLMLVCFSGCRGKKEQEQQQGQEAGQSEEIEIVPPDGQQGLTVDEDPLEIVVPEDSELVGD